MDSRKITLTCGFCRKLFESDMIDNITDTSLYMVDCPECTERMNREYERSMAYRARYEEEYRRRKLFDSTGLIEEFVDFSEDIGNMGLYNFVRSNMDKSLWIGGKTGVGKTRAVTAVAYLLACHHRTVLFKPTTALLREVMGLYAEDMRDADREIHRISSVDVLVMDDLGKEKLTERAIEVFFEIIDRRYVAKKRTWITTNFTGKGFLSKIGVFHGEPIFRRLSEDFVKYEQEAQ